MGIRYQSEMITEDAQIAQQASYGRAQATPAVDERDAIGPQESAFISERDSFYLATVTSTGWPYVQHRGGPAGFLRVLDPHTLAFADLKGNRQLITTGNLRSNQRASLLLMDYPQRSRLKIIGETRTIDARQDPDLADRVAPSPELRSRVERVMVIDVVGFDWNCPAYITPRYSEDEVEQAVARLRRRVAELEEQLAALTSG